MTAYSYSCYNSLIRHQSPCSSATSAEPSDFLATTVSNPISVLSMYLPSFLLSPPLFLLCQWFCLFSLPPLFLALFPLSIAPQSPPCIFPNPIHMKAFSMICLWSTFPLLLCPFHLPLIQRFLVRFLCSPLRFLSNRLLLPHRCLPKIRVHPLPTSTSSLPSVNLSPTLKSLHSARHSELLVPLTTTFVKNASRGLSLSISGNLGRTLAASWI